MPEESAHRPQSADTPTNRGWFKPGHVHSVSHGLFSPRDLANLEAEVDAFLSESIADDGGESEISARRRSLLAYRARVHRRIVQLDNALEVRGLLDGRGKLRVAWLQSLQGLIATAKGIDGVAIGHAHDTPPQFFGVGSTSSQQGSGEYEGDTKTTGSPDNRVR